MIICVVKCPFVGFCEISVAQVRSNHNSILNGVIRVKNVESNGVSRRFVSAVSLALLTVTIGVATFVSLVQLKDFRKTDVYYEETLSFSFIVIITNYITSQIATARQANNIQRTHRKVG